jgi:hypothetical protein
MTVASRKPVIAASCRCVARARFLADPAWRLAAARSNAASASSSRSRALGIVDHGVHPDVPKNASKSISWIERA